MLQIKSATYQHESVNFRLFLQHATQKEEKEKELSAALWRDIEIGE